MQQIHPIASRLNYDSQSGQLHIQIVPPNQTIRNPCHIICVVDISGSMSTKVTLPQENGEKEYFDLEVLDVVKHSIATLLTSLSSSDSLSIISFSNQAHLLLEHAPMDEPGKALAAQTLKTLKPDGLTNLWGGLALGLEVSKIHHKNNVNSGIFLLTDGCPTIEPPRGHLKSLQKYAIDNRGLPAII